MSIGRLASTIFEIVILFATLALVFHNFVMDFRSGGDLKILAWVYFGMLFLVASVLYASLSILLASREKHLLVYISIGALFAIPIVFSAFVFTVLGNEGVAKSRAIALASLPVIPLILLTLRYIIFRAMLGNGKESDVEEDEKAQ